MRPPILSLLSTPSVAERWGVAEWADTLPRLIQAGLGGHAAALLEAQGVLLNSLPAGVHRQLKSSSIESMAQLRSLRWELGEVVRALRGLDVRVVPLKGADYLIREATPAHGRTVADLDLLVAPSELGRATSGLTRAGWQLLEATSLHPNHQLPMMIHRDRKTQLEMHFQVVAEGGTIAFDVAEVLAQAAPLPDGVLALLTPEDTTLVCVAHYIRNKRSISAFRDLLDLHELVEDFSSRDPQFGAILGERAERVGLGGALARALRDAARLFGTGSTPALYSWSARRRPVFAGGSVLALVPDGCDAPSLSVRISRVGRMYARTRSALPRGQTLLLAWKTLFGEDEEKEQEGISRRPSDA